MLLKKVVYPYETTLPERKEFYSNLNLGHITDADYMHAKRVRRDFHIKDIGEYHDFYFKSEVLLLAGIFKIYFSSWISMASIFKKDICIYIF